MSMPGSYKSVQEHHPLPLPVQSTGQQVSVGAQPESLQQVLQHEVRRLVTVVEDMSKALQSLQSSKTRLEQRVEKMETEWDHWHNTQSSWEEPPGDISQQQSQHFQK